MLPFRYISEIIKDCYLERSIFIKKMGYDDGKNMLLNFLNNEEKILKKYEKKYMINWF